MQLAVADGVLSQGTTVFDYGCGHGDDIRYLRAAGFPVLGWDPKFAPEQVLVPSDVVNLGYVLNVIENQGERTEALRRAWGLAKACLVVSARPAWESREVRGRPHADGIVTAKDTFQKFFEQDELRSYIESATGQRAIAAAPGIFYVFREDAAAQAVLARRARRSHDGANRVAALLYELHRDDLRVVEAFVEAQRRLPGPGDLAGDTLDGLIETFGSLRSAFLVIRRATGHTRWTDVDTGRPTGAERRYEQSRALLEPLVAFVEERGRVPQLDELPEAADIVAAFGSLRTAFSVVRRATGADRWTLASERARRNFIVYLALAAFGGRPRFSELPGDLQLDVRELFGTYKAAVADADRLLFGAGDAQAIDKAARTSDVGKLTPEALYVHVTAVEDLPPLLRVYEGCGQALAGTVEEATIVKLHREKPQVSYLSYPTFDRDPHPSLATVLVARLDALRLTYRDFRGSDNPPILHRKETFVGPGYPNRDRFARLTAQEERHGLLSSPTIGTMLGWQDALMASGVALKGHRVIRSTNSVGHIIATGAAS